MNEEYRVCGLEDPVKGQVCVRWLGHKGTCVDAFGDVVDGWYW